MTTLPIVSTNLYKRKVRALELTKFCVRLNYPSEQRLGSKKSYDVIVSNPLTVIHNEHDSPLVLGGQTYKFIYLFWKQPVTSDQKIGSINTTIYHTKTVNLYH